MKSQTTNSQMIQKGVRLRDLAQGKIEDWSGIKDAPAMPPVLSLTPSAKD